MLFFRPISLSWCVYSIIGPTLVTIISFRDEFLREPDVLDAVVSFAGTTKEDTTLAKPQVPLSPLIHCPSYSPRRNLESNSSNQQRSKERVLKPAHTDTSNSRKRKRDLIARVLRFEDEPPHKLESNRLKPNQCENRRNSQRKVEYSLSIRGKKSQRETIKTRSSNYFLKQTVSPEEEADGSHACLRAPQLGESTFSKSKEQQHQQIRSTGIPCDAVKDENRSRNENFGSKDERLYVGSSLKELEGAAASTYPSEGERNSKGNVADRKSATDRLVALRKKVVFCV